MRFLWPPGSGLRVASPGADTLLAGLESRGFGPSPLLHTRGALTRREGMQQPHLFIYSSSPLLPAAMNSGVCLCVLMAALAAGALAQPVPPPDSEGPGAPQDEEAARRQLRAAQRLDGEPRAHLGALLARYIQPARKGTDGASPSLTSAPARGSQS